VALMERTVLEKYYRPAPEQVGGRIGTCMNMPSVGLKAIEWYWWPNWFCQQPSGGTPSFFELNFEVAPFGRLLGSQESEPSRRLGVSEWNPCLSGSGAQPPSGSVAG